MFSARSGPVFGRDSAFSRRGLSGCGESGKRTKAHGHFVDFPHQGQLHMGTIQLVTGTEALAVKHLSTGRFGQNDMHEAHCIQASLLPTGPMQNESFQIAFRYTPFSEVGGDFADFFRLPDGLIGIYLGDVVGKGCRRQCMAPW